MTMRKEYRAVFTDSHGPYRSYLAMALKDRPERSEETLEELVGVEVREVTDWKSVPVSEIIKATNDDVKKALGIKDA